MRTKKERIANKKRQYLECIGWYEERIDSLQRVLKAEEHKKTGVKAIDYAKEQLKGGNKNSWEALIDKTDKYKKDIVTMSTQLIERKNEVLQIIDKVEDPRSSLLLTLRYVERLEWEKIENIMNISQNTRNKYHSEALEKIWIPKL